MSTPSSTGPREGQCRAEDLRSLVVVPTYNERLTMPELIRAVLGLGPQFEILVVDDHSPDGTADAVRELAADDPRVHLIERAGKLGLGSAYVAGFRYALERTEVDLVIQMDADFSHDPGEIAALIEAAREADLVLGSRYVCGVTVVNWPLRRLFLSYGANVYTRLITGLPFRDATGGFKCFRREVLQALDWDHVRSDGYSFQIETTYLAWRRGFAIREIPIVFTDRRVGVSKMNRRIVWEAIFLVWRLGFSGLLHRWPHARLAPALTPRSQRGGSG